jgi:hypothetical protein
MITGLASIMGDDNIIKIVVINIALNLKRNKFFDTKGNCGITLTTSKYSLLKD